MPIRSLDELEHQERQEYRARAAGACRGYEFVSAFRPPPDPDDENERPADQTPSQELIAAVREVLGA
ncbi:hypothetical protein AUC71_07760 [Methyloceanibacter marginalis]|uniref:Uncharacterized protein n=1 Tax=Methyloceanibacter marginalis TaxID=1774971 RepID=A0A1E3WE55_9HYPH|nr:hypothetical protein AUC71_07760 [Methyloceanibacter marginalis]